MPDLLTLDDLAKGRTYKPRPDSTQYILRKPSADRPGIRGTLKTPTDELVEAYDMTAREKGRKQIDLEAAVARLSAAKRALKIEAGSETPDADRVDELAEAVKDARLEAERFDPANPEGEAYYVDDIRRRGSLALELVFVERDGATKYKVVDGDVDLSEERGVETGVLDRAVEDFLGLAFSTGTSRSA